MIGTIWTHLKRGTSYRIIAVATAGYGEELKDDDLAYFMIIRRDYTDRINIIVRPENRPFSSVVEETVRLKIPILVQISGTLPTSETEWVIYQSLQSGDFYARPKDEFTPERFVQHT